MLPTNLETLKNMNGTTSRFAKWYVRVCDPKVVDYTFKARGETVDAQKFQRVLVSNAPEQYMLGLVPFDFKDRRAAANALRKFEPDSVWELTTPVFDNKVKPVFIGCPVKHAVMLTRPTVVTRVPPTSTVAFAYPARGLKVALDIKGIVGLLKGSASGTTSRRTFDFCGKFLGMGASKQTQSAGTLLNVSEAEFTHAGG